MSGLSSRSQRIIGGLVLVLATAACGSEPFDGGPFAGGAIDPLMSGSSWETVALVSGQYTPHGWSGVILHYHFHGSVGSMRANEEEPGSYLAFYGTQDTFNNGTHAVRLQLDDADRPVALDNWGTGVDIRTSLEILRSGTLWNFEYDVYDTSTEIWHRTYIDDTVNDLQRIGISVPLAYSVPFAKRVKFGFSQRPYFTAGFRVASPPTLKEVMDTTGVAHDEYHCDLCVTDYYLITDPFVVDRRLYWPAFRSPGGISELAIFTPLDGFDHQQGNVTYYRERLVTQLDAIPFTLEGYDQFTSHVAGTRVYLTWLGPTKVTQYVFDTVDQSLTPRIQELPLNLDLPIAVHRLNDVGDIYLLLSNGKFGGRVAKITPSGIEPVGGPIELSQTPPAGAVGYLQELDNMYLYNGRVFVTATGNGHDNTQPQLALLRYVE